jgi:hypothetical protein
MLRYDAATRVQKKSDGACFLWNPFGSCWSIALHGALVRRSWVLGKGRDRLRCNAAHGTAAAAHCCRNLSLTPKSRGLLSPAPLVMSQVDVGFEVTPFSSKESHPAPKAYTLTLEFEHGDERLSGAHITPADVDVSDLVTSFISVSSLWVVQRGVAASHPSVARCEPASLVSLCCPLVDGDGILDQGTALDSICRRCRIG